MGLISRGWQEGGLQARAGPRADILSGSLEDAMSIGRVSTIWSNKKRNARRYKNRTCVRAPATTNSSAFPAGPRSAGRARAAGPHEPAPLPPHPRNAPGGGGADGAGGAGGGRRRGHPDPHAAARDSWRTRSSHKRNTSIIIRTTWPSLHVVEGRIPSVTAVQAFSQLSPPMW